MASVDANRSTLRLDLLVLQLLVLAHDYKQIERFFFEVYSKHFRLWLYDPCFWRIYWTFILYYAVDWRTLKDVWRRILHLNFISAGRRTNCWMRCFTWLTCKLASRQGSWVMKCQDSGFCTCLVHGCEVTGNPDVWFNLWGRTFRVRFFESDQHKVVCSVVRKGAFPRH